MSPLVNYNQITSQTQKRKNFIFPCLGKTFHFFKPENLLPFTQDHTTCPPHKQDKFLPHLSLFWLYLRQCLPFTPRSPERSLALNIQLKFWIRFYHTICVTCPTHPSLQHLRKLAIQFMLQIMKVLNVQFSPFSCYFLSCMFQYSPQGPAFNHYICVSPSCCSLRFCVCSAVLFFLK